MQIVFTCELSAVPIWTAEQEIHVLELLGKKAWLHSSPEYNSQPVSHVRHSGSGFSWWYWISYCIYSISSKEKQKGKMLSLSGFCTEFSTTAPFCTCSFPAFHAISFTKPFPSLGLGNWLWWQSNLLSPRCHTKWAQWEDVESNCMRPREWQISDWELNKSAQVRSKIPAWDSICQEFQC